MTSEKEEMHIREVAQDSQSSTNDWNLGKITGFTSAIVLIHEYVVDFFACLIPGIFTFLIFLIILVSTSNIILTIIDYDVSNFNKLFFLNKEITVSFSNIGRIMSVIIFSYIIGFLLYRQDPDKPDKISAYYNWLNTSEDVREYSILNVIINNNDYYFRKHYEYRGLRFSLMSAFFGALYFKNVFKLTREEFNKNDQNLTFPYYGLKCFLCKNKNENLANLVSWKRCDSSYSLYLTKNFINKIKLNLFSHSNKLYNIICRNEAHVRLCTSLWFSCKYLIYCFVLSLLFFILFSCSLFVVILCSRECIFYEYWLSYINKLFDAFPCFSVLLIIFLLLIFIIYKITQCLNYMRIREIIYLLEAINIVESESGYEIMNKYPCKSCIT